MKGEWEMRRRFSVAAAALALSVALTVPAYAGTWKYVNDQWKYQRGTNKFAYNEWIKDNGKYYYIGNDGIMKTGWQQVSGKWYHLSGSGAMRARASLNWRRCATRAASKSTLSRR